MTIPPVLRRVMMWTAAVVLTILAAAMLFALSHDASPYSPADVRRLADLLNEGAATDVPHHSLMTEEQRQTHAALLAKVESGRQLSAAESARYRALYQATLQQNQAKLALFDSNLTILTDVDMARPNNVGGRGIAHSHDHHDVSARSNFDDMMHSLDAITRAKGPLGWATRISNANQAYKNLTDIVLHLGTAPQTVSVGYVPRGSVPDRMTADFETMLAAYKAAQFSPVNSPAYVADVHRALGAYDNLVLAVQARVNRDLSPFERRLAGRWLAPQTLSASPDPAVKIRFPR